MVTCLVRRHVMIPVIVAISLLRHGAEGCEKQKDQEEEGNDPLKQYRRFASR